MYKYQCRGCRLQETCIDQSDTLSAVKVMIRHAFEARTDTASTWGVLQNNCLLVKEDEEREQQAGEGTPLAPTPITGDTGTAEDQPADKDAEEISPATDDPEEDTVTPGPTIVAPVQAEPEPEPEQDTSFYDTASIPERDRSKTSEQRAYIGNESFATEPLSSSSTTPSLTDDSELFLWLTVSSSQRRISLPRAGELILGRFDPSLEDPLDVDLTYEDQSSSTVSRRHARITAIEGQLRIEDLHSSNGLFINGRRVRPGEARPLKPGYRLRLGALELTFEPVPAAYLQALMAKQDQVRSYLFFTHTGRKEMITPPKMVTIGRSDPTANVQPTIDLGEFGDVATYVSRRHAVITWGKHNPFLKDTQSTYGTRLNGEQLLPNQAIALKPGDHISLGGCVLAYDIEL